jgi:hypothetical protein
MWHQDLSQSWELFLAERPLLKEQYAAWLLLHPDLPSRMRSHREHFIKTVGLTDADRDAWLAIGVQGHDVPRLSWDDPTSWGQASAAIAEEEIAEGAATLRQLLPDASVDSEVSEDRAA